MDHEDDIIDRLDIYEVRSEEEAVKSSVQARFSIELKWTPPTSKNSEQKGFRKFFKSFFKENYEKNREDDLLTDADEYIDIDGINSGINSYKVEKSNDDIIDITSDQDLTEKNLPEKNSVDKKIPEETRIDDKMSGRDLNDNTVEDETPEVEEFVDNKIPEVEEDFLPVTVVVKVWVDVNLPVNKELSSTLSFPPVKVCVYIRMRIRIKVCIYIYVCMYYICMYMFIYAYILYMYLCTYLNLSECLCIYLDLKTYAHIYTYLNILSYNSYYIIVHMLY
jgi:hypothetical protein